MENISSLISKKYLAFKQKDSSVSFMIRICFFGILIGSFALMLTLIVMNGFEKQIHEKMQGINAQVIIHSPGNKLDYQNIKKHLETNFPNEVAGISGQITRQVILDRNKDHSVLFIKGIDPENEAKVTQLHQKITLPIFKNKKESLKTLLTKNGIIIGIKTAEQQKLNIGDEITILIPKAGGRSKINLKKRKATVTGFFKIGLEDYDNNLAFASLSFLKELFKEGEGVDQIYIKLKNDTSSLFHRNSEERIISNLQKDLSGLSVSSWKEFYPALVASLKLEKYVMFFILVLIVLVASMNLISLLSMQIQQKKRDIAIFKTMGMRNHNIRNIFLKLGMKLTFWASSIGLGLAAIGGFFLERYPFIELPDVYYISHLPATMDFEIFIVVFLATMLIGFLAVWIPVQRTKKINITQVLRQE